MLRTYIEKHQNNAILAAVITSVLAFVGVFGNAVITYYYNTQQQDRQIKIEQVSKFDVSSNDLITAAGAFINAINDGKELDVAKKQLSAALANQTFTAENIQKYYGTDVSKLVREYQGAITELSQIAQKTSSVTGMRIWAEALGRVLDARAALSNQLHRSLGNKVASSA